MEIPTPTRTLLRIQLILIRWSILIITTLIWSNILQGHRAVPGAQNAPINSRIGKLESPDRGGCFKTSNFFKHNVFFQYRDEAKLIPRSRLIHHSCLWLGNMPKDILNGELSENVLNIILIIQQSPTKYNLAELSTFYAHHVDNSNIPNIGMCPGLDLILGLGMLDETVLQLISVRSASQNGQERLSCLYSV